MPSLAIGCVTFNTVPPDVLSCRCCITNTLLASVVSATSVTIGDDLIGCGVAAGSNFDSSSVYTYSAMPSDAVRPVVE